MVSLVYSKRLSVADFVELGNLMSKHIPDPAILSERYCPSTLTIWRCSQNMMRNEYLCSRTQDTEVWSEPPGTSPSASESFMLRLSESSIEVETISPSSWTDKISMCSGPELSLLAGPENAFVKARWNAEQIETTTRWVKRSPALPYRMLKYPAKKSMKAEAVSVSWRLRLMSGWVSEITVDNSGCIGWEVGIWSRAKVTGGRTVRSILAEGALVFWIS